MLFRRENNISDFIKIKIDVFNDYYFLIIWRLILIMDFC